MHSDVQENDMTSIEVSICDIHFAKKYPYIVQKKLKLIVNELSSNTQQQITEKFFL